MQKMICREGVREVFILKIIGFVKKHYEIFVVNVIVLGVIFIIMLAQFGVHIKVDKDVDLVPVEIGYSQDSTVRVTGKYVPVSRLYVKLRYENNEQKTFWLQASVVFGRAGEDDMKDMIKGGGPIKRNVFLNTGSNEVIGVTEHGKSILSLYYYNSRLFRHGIWILIIVDIFVGVLIKRLSKR